MSKKKEKKRGQDAIANNSITEEICKNSDLREIEQIDLEISEQHSDKPQNSEDDFSEKLKSATKDLIYISETDADILPFLGEVAESVDGSNLLSQIKFADDAKIEELDYQNFFAHPAKIQEWFDEERTETAKKYQAIKVLMEENLTDIKYFKVGKTEIEIYVVGLDKQNRLVGIKTEAVET